MKIPQHIAIIMDGNGRWAQRQGKERIEGHVRGVESVRAAIRASILRGVKYLTLYAFSTENWGRPQEEVDALMLLMCQSIVSETPELKKEGVKVAIIGDKSRFSQEVCHSLEYIEAETSAGQRLNLTLALNYSSRDELRRGVCDIVRRVQAGELLLTDVDEDVVSKSLDTRCMPDPDLVIRTSGECRLSNFMLWQVSYSELYFMDVLWPDFELEHFDNALAEYARRNRRYGKL